jgi:hypothetical protein
VIAVVWGLVFVVAIGAVAFYAVVQRRTWEAAEADIDAKLRARYGSEVTYQPARWSAAPWYIAGGFVFGLLVLLAGVAL